MDCFDTLLCDYSVYNSLIRCSFSFSYYQQHRFLALFHGIHPGGHTIIGRFDKAQKLLLKSLEKQDVDSCLETGQAFCGNCKGIGNACSVKTFRLSYYQYHRCNTCITGVTHVNGRSAMMMNKYALGSKDIVQIVNGKHTIVGASKQLNQTTIKDLEKLKQKLLTDNIQIDDLQFLIDGSGNVVINDPRAILVGNGKPPIKNFRVINKLIKASRKNL